VSRGHLFVDAEHEPVLGNPVAVFITASDERDLLTLDSKPTTLLQKLVRAVESQTIPTARSFGDVFGELVNTADNKPEHLVRYTKQNQYLSDVAPAVSITQQTPAPVAPVVEPEPVDALLTAEVPRTWARLVVPAEPENYLKRKIDGLDEDEFYDIGLANGDAFLLSGEAGVGKTESVVHLANRLGLPLVRLEMHQSLSLADTEGRLLPTPTGGWQWHYSRLATGIKHGAVILLNELSRSLPSNATLFLGILQEGQLQIEQLNEVIPVHPNTIFIADQNIGARYVGTREQDHALLDRFNVKLEFNDDPAIESQLIPSPSLLEIANAMRFLSKSEPSKHRTRVGLRMLLNFVKQAKAYNFTWAVNRFIANFPPAEREAISLQFEAKYLNIAQELGVSVGDYDPSNNPVSL
jgi:hypothetical protein